MLQNKENLVIKVDEEINLVLVSLETASRFFDLIENNREELSKWFPWTETTHSIDDVGKYLLGCIESYNKGEDLDLGIYYKNEWVGRAGLHRFQKSKKIAEISYWLDQSFEGRGIMSRSICTLCKYGFTTLDIK